MHKSRIHERQTMSNYDNLHCYVIIIVLSCIRIFTISTAYQSFTHSRNFSNSCQLEENAKFERNSNESKTIDECIQPLKDQKLDPITNHNNFE